MESQTSSSSSSSSPAAIAEQIIQQHPPSVWKALYAHLKVKLMDGFPGVPKENKYVQSNLEEEESSVVHELNKLYSNHLLNDIYGHDFAAFNYQLDELLIDGENVGKLPTVDVEWLKTKADSPAEGESVLRVAGNRVSFNTDVPSRICQEMMDTADLTGSQLLTHVLRELRIVHNDELIHLNQQSSEHIASIVAIVESKGTTLIDMDHFPFTPVMSGYVTLPNSRLKLASNNPSPSASILFIIDIYDAESTQLKLWAVNTSKIAESTLKLFDQQPSLRAVAFPLKHTYHAPTDSSQLTGADSALAKLLQELDLHTSYDVAVYETFESGQSARVKTIGKQTCNDIHFVIPDELPHFGLLDSESRQRHDTCVNHMFTTLLVYAS